MTDFIALKTHDGDVFVNIDDISYIRKSGMKDKTVVVLKNKTELIIDETYDDVINFVAWVVDGRPDLDIDECPTCGNKKSDDDKDLSKN